DHVDGAGHRHRDLERLDTTRADGVRDRHGFFARGGTDHRHDAELDDARHDLVAGHRATRAVPPRITRSTSASVAMLVSPGVVIASAPWAAPHSTAHCAPFSARKP